MHDIIRTLIKIASVAALLLIFACVLLPFWVSSLLLFIALTLLVSIVESDRIDGPGDKDI